MTVVPNVALDVSSHVGVVATVACVCVAAVACVCLCFRAAAVFACVFVASVACVLRCVFVLWLWLPAFFKQI